ncbi:hypothetical protein CLNEO_09610 [Anaerotignum neopropionicum]|uniref:Uncharacterized protein n=1 Tax=Anaerotignum neopropionicum TaxID=36847 RepID=A0A136WGU2_9FIRM|nr:hypothetical protein CLNEO_09610 [Anaerotignum neopropionicum]
MGKWNLYRWSNVITAFAVIMTTWSANWMQQKSFVNSNV